MTLRLEAFIEHCGRESLLFVRALPGFQVSGRGAADPRSRSAGALQAHLDWLVERDLIDRLSTEVELVVAGELTSAAGGAGPRFLADLAAPSEDEVESALAVGRAALSDLIDAFEALSFDDLNESPPKTLRHVARLDRWYAGHLGLITTSAALVDVIDDLVDAAGTFEEAVDEFIVSSRPELVSIDGEEWTLAKALRRRTGHLREHLIDIGPSS